MSLLFHLLSFFTQLTPLASHLDSFFHIFLVALRQNLRDSFTPAFKIASGWLVGVGYFATETVKRKFKL